MRGYPNFNFPAFDSAAQFLRDAGHFVFSPAERDKERHGGVDIGANNPTGSEELAKQQHGFSLREALRDDCIFICMEAEAIAMLPGWEKSKGAVAEHALSVALGHKVIIL